MAESLSWTETKKAVESLHEWVRRNGERVQLSSDEEYLPKVPFTPS